MAIENNVKSLGTNNSQGHVIKIGDSETSVSGIFINISADSPLANATMDELHAVLSRPDVTIVPFVKSGNKTTLEDLLPTDYSGTRSEEAAPVTPEGEGLFEDAQQS